MKKICHITSVHNAYDGRIFEKECCSLAKAGYQVYLVAPNTTNHKHKGVIIIGVDVKKNGRLYRIFKFTKEVYKKALLIDADIYHLHDPELLPFGVRLKRKGKIVIFDSHESVPEQINSKEYIPLFIRKFISFVYSKYEKIILKKYDAIVTVTPHIVDRLIKINKKTVQITNYPIVEEIPPVNPCPNNNICFAGTIGPLWMSENIIKSLAHLKGICFNLAGPISDSYLTQLKGIDVFHKMNYVGKIPHSEVLHFIQDSKIGMALYDYSLELGTNIGTLGNTKLFEYMKAGIPVICTDFILWKKIFEDGNCGLCVNPRDVSSITEAINYILSHPEKAIEMGKNGQRAIQATYNWKTQETILLNLYKDLLS